MAITSLEGLLKSAEILELPSLEEIERRAKAVLLKPRARYFGRNFEIVTDRAKKVPFERLVFDLQRAFCRGEHLRSNRIIRNPQLAQKIFVNISDIAKMQKLGDLEFIKSAATIIPAFWPHLNKCLLQEDIVRKLQWNLSLLVIAKKFVMFYAREGYYNLQTIEVDKQRALTLRTVSVQNGVAHYALSDDLAKLVDSSAEALAFLSRWSRINDDPNLGSYFHVMISTNADFEVLRSAKVHSDKTVVQIAELFEKTAEGDKVFVAHEKLVEDLAVLIKALTSLDKGFSRFLKEYSPVGLKLMEYMDEDMKAYEQRKRKKVFGNLSPESLQKRLSLYKEYLSVQERPHASYMLFYRMLQSSELFANYQNCLYPCPGIIEEALPTPETFIGWALEESIESDGATEKTRETKAEIAPAQEEKREKKEGKRRRQKARRGPPIQTPLIQRRSSTTAKPQPLRAEEIQTAQEAAPAPEPEQRELEPSDRKMALVVELPQAIQQLFSGRKLPGGKTEINYDARVLDWLEEGGSRALERSDYTDLDEVEKARALEVHAFTTVLDRFVGTAYSFKTTWKNPTSGEVDDLYLIPAEVQLTDGTVMRGDFQYTFGAKDHACYHRCLSRKASDVFVRSLMTRTFFDILDYPPMKISAKMATRHAKPFEMDGGRVRVIPNPFSDMITIDDVQRHMLIKIFHFNKA